MRGVSTRHIQQRATASAVVVGVGGLAVRAVPGGVTGEVDRRRAVAKAYGNRPLISIPCPAPTRLVCGCF